MGRRNGFKFQIILSKRKRKRLYNKLILGLIAIYFVTKLISEHTRFFTTFLVLFIFLCVLTALIYFGYKSWNRNKLRKSGISDIDEMTGREFEQRLEVLFSDLGYSVDLTPESGDYGADLVIKNGSGKTVVQAKRYSHPVGLSAIQEVTTSIAYYSAKNAMVVTNNYFTPQAKELASRNKIELWERDKLINMLTAGNRKSEEKVMDKSVNSI